MQLFEVKGIGCGSCVAKITQAVQTLDSDAVIEINRADGQVMVESKLPAEAILEAITALGFPTQAIA